MRCLEEAWTCFWESFYDVAVRDSTAKKPWQMTPYDWFVAGFERGRKQGHREAHIALREALERQESGL